MAAWDRALRLWMTPLLLALVGSGCRCRGRYDERAGPTASASASVRGAPRAASWALRLGDARVQRATAVAMDGDDVLVAGDFEGTLAFALGGADAETTLTSAGSTDIFVARLDRSGRVRWMRRFGGTAEESLQGMAVDTAGNIALTGSFCGSLDFGGKALTCARGLDVFVAKLDRQGGAVFSLAAGAPDTHEMGNAIAFDHAGNVLVTGQAQGAIDLGGGALAAEGEASVFVAKLDPSGRHLWSKRFGNEEEQVANAIAIDAKDNVYVTGRFEGDVDFGGGKLHAAFKDVFLLTLDAQGRHLASKRFGDPTGAAPADGRCVAVDKDGNVTLAGVFTSTIDFGGGPLAGAGDTDIFLAKLDAAGAHLWSRRYGDSSFQSVWGITLDGSGAIVLTGSFGGSFDLGGGPVAAAGKDLFVARVSADGTPDWLFRAGDQAAQEGRALVVDPQGGIVVAGSFEGTLSLAPSQLVSQGSLDAFVARMTP